MRFGAIVVMLCAAFVSAAPIPECGGDQKRGVEVPRDLKGCGVPF
ncbi:hypothetical protein ANO11243_091450 [Dothideomycetidae sp. 11243]|nr:hypothetical protein ANO11243_091450 [fungal sp. No.11243]